MTKTIEVWSRVRDIVAEVAGVEPCEVKLDMKLGGDELEIGRVVGAGEFLELRTKLEKAFGAKIPDDKIPSYDKFREVTVEQLVTLVEELLK